MSFVKLQRHDIIKVEKGMVINAKIPEKFTQTKDVFSEKIVEKEFVVGKIYHFPHPALTVGKINSNIHTTIEDKLISYGLNPDVFNDKIKNFIKDLDLKLEKDTFDASIYEGEYKVYFTLYEHGEYWVFCEKLDDSGIEIKFSQDYDENEKVKVLTKQTK